MNIDTIAGEGTTAKGRIKETFGNATADPRLKNEGIADQLAGNVRQAFGAMRDFARAQPLLAALALGLIGASVPIRERPHPTKSLTGSLGPHLAPAS